jgi:hypothetical protein
MFWFHATKCLDEGGYLTIISDGCSPPPPHVDTGTKQLELQLAISDAHVYCFLGRTLEQFGQFCIVLRTDGVPERYDLPIRLGRSGSQDSSSLNVGSGQAERVFELALDIVDHIGNANCSLSG